MIAEFYSRVADQDRLRRGPLGLYVDGFAGLLFEQGYSGSVGRQKIRLVADLSRWLERKQLGIEALNEQRIADFLKARRKRFRRHHNDEPTLALFLQRLRQQNVLPDIPKSGNDSPIDLIACRYARFLSQERRLSSITLDHYLPVARRFLSHRFGIGGIRLVKLRSQDVTQFILQDTSIFSLERTQLVMSALRSFLSFLYQGGETTTNLAAAVPHVANRRGSELPQVLEPAEVERLLKTCEQRSPVGQRDYAILLLLARLGLRAGEVAHLCLGDIHWETGDLLIRGKGAREDRLPLLKEVGQALARYLEQGRPRCSCPRVFIRMAAPRQGFYSSTAISDIVRRALDRAQLRPKRKGAHVLRHFLATQLLRHGASLTQIGQVLRHQFVETTEIYARVDLPALRALAQPWPGGAR
jgi:site-specific recombinase XerD